MHAVWNSELFPHGSPHKKKTGRIPRVGLVTRCAAEAANEAGACVTGDGSHIGLDLNGRRAYKRPPSRKLKWRPSPTMM